MMQLSPIQVSFIKWLAGFIAIAHERATDKKGLTIFDIPAIILQSGRPPNVQGAVGSLAGLDEQTHETARELLKDELRQRGIEGEEIEELGAELFDGFWKAGRFIVGIAAWAAVNSGMLQTIHIRVGHDAEAADIEQLDDQLDDNKLHAKRVKN
jgi:hypothetical protein